MKPQIEINPNFNRFKDTLQLKKTDRIPQFDFNIHDEIKSAIIGRPLKNAQDEVDFWVNSGYDYIQVRLKPKTMKIGKSVAKATQHGTLETLQQLKSQEFEWTKIYNNTWDLDDYNLDTIREIANLMPKDMKLLIHGADIYTRSWIAMGFENFCYAIYEEPELLEELFYENYVAEQRMFDVLFEEVGDKIGGILYSDDLAYTEGLMISAEVYRQYLFPYVDKLFSKGKELGLPIIYHTDGKLWDVFDDFSNLGVNGIQPLEPKSMNLTELKEKEGGRFCLMGSIDIDLVSRGSADDVEKMVKERIETIGKNGGYMVGTSNTVPEYVKVENYIAMIEACRKYGKLK